MKVSPVDIETVLKGKSVGFLEKAISQVKDELHEVELMLRVLDPPLPPSTLPLCRLIIRDESEMQKMTEADLVQEIFLVKSGLLRLTTMIGGDVTKEQDHLSFDIASTAQELDHISKRDMVVDVGSNELFCLCRLPYNGSRMMIQCDSCEDWFHITCVGLLYQNVPNTEEYVCPRCNAYNRQSGAICDIWDTEEEQEHVSIDSVLCRKGERWLEVEIEAVSREIDAVTNESKRLQRVMTRERAKENHRLAEEAALSAAAKAKETREKAKKKKDLRKRRIEETKRANENEAVSDLTGAALRNEIGKIMLDYGITQSSIISETAIVGGAAAVSGLLKGAQVPKKVEKELVLRRWLSKTHARIERGELQKRSTDLLSKSPTHTYAVGDFVETCSSKNEWVQVEVVDVVKNRIKVRFPVGKGRRDSWLPLQSDRLASIGTHTDADNGRANKRERQQMGDEATESEFKKRKNSFESDDCNAVGSLNQEETAAIMSLRQLRADKGK